MTNNNSSVNKLLGSIQQSTNGIMNQNNSSSKVLLVMFVVILLISIVFALYVKIKSRARIRLASEPLFLTTPWVGHSELVIPGKNLPTDNNSQFSYSFWIYIDQKKWVSPRYNDKNKWKHIMHFGDILTRNATPESNRLNQQQIPGVWLWPGTNRLWIVVTTDNGPDYGEGVIVDDIPLNKWVNVTAILWGQMVEIYLDGKLEKTVALYHRALGPRKGQSLFISSTEYRETTTAIDDTYDTNFTHGTTTTNGFPGFISYVNYYNKSLSPVLVKDLYDKTKSKLEEWSYEKLILLRNSENPICSENPDMDIKCGEDPLITDDTLPAICDPTIELNNISTDENVRLQNLKTQIDNTGASNWLNKSSEELNTFMTNAP
jgi:hypothetical protein